MNKKKNTRQTDSWSIRGIPPETRTAALVASRRAGQTIGEWISRAIHEHAKTATAAPALAGEDVLQAILTQLEKRDQATADLAARIERMETRKGFLSRLFGG